MQNNPLVSILIPAFNRAALLHETLDSIIAQTYTNWECIVVDDGSTDATLNVLKVYAQKEPRIQYASRPTTRPKGANACRNYAFELSKGTYIQWFDSDDAMHAEKIETKVKALQNTEFDFAVCEGVEYKDSFSNVIRKWNQIHSNQVLEDHITGKVNFHTNGPLFKRSFLADKKLFDESLMRKQEWEFYSRLLSQSTNYKPVYKALYFFRSHEDSMNGKNHISTLKSRIHSNQLVYTLVKNNFNKEKVAELRIHFFYKFLLHFKLAKQSKNKSLIWFSFKSLWKHLTFKDLINGFFKLFSKPQILKNIFRS
ncbi:glycosyltransferase family 2 protein [Flavicella sediminum]|uniref:glycosyltransferase family 2 protein n=1 Tax=Flavicella sediminum TaxID=2585141 RepID=UPI001122C09C|nr:glycosyltransferase family 2 protein [Flavicella sediminum]